MRHLRDKFNVMCNFAFENALQVQSYPNFFIQIQYCIQSLMVDGLQFTSMFRMHGYFVSYSVDYTAIVISGKVGIP